MEEPRPSTPSKFATWLGIASLLLVAALLPLYLLRPDFAAAATLIPPWAWLALGVVLNAFAFRKRRVARWCLGAWLLFGALTVDELRGAVRFGPPIAGAARPKGADLRVATFNCAGIAPAASEPATFRPDIVLLQESVSSAELERLTSTAYKGYSVVSGPDASILARGELERIDLPKGVLDCTLARATVAGKTLLIVSLRLNPPVGRVDLWNPTCWRAQAEDRRARRLQLRAILERVQCARRGEPVVLGGDFNAVAGDAIFRELAAFGLSDTYSAASGPGNTAVIDYPFARIDSIWVSKEILPVVHDVVRSEHSDHRMVLADLRYAE